MGFPRNILRDLAFLKVARESFRELMEYPEESLEGPWRSESDGVGPPAA